MRNTQEATCRAEAAEAAIGALRESETTLHRENQATQRDFETASGECAAAVRDRQVSVSFGWIMRKRDQALCERDERMRNIKTKDAKIERLRKLAY